MGELTGIGLGVAARLIVLLVAHPLSAAAVLFEYLFDQMLRREESERDDFVEVRRKRRESIEFLQELARGGHRSDRTPLMLLRLARLSEATGRLEESEEDTRVAELLYRALLQDSSDLVPVDEVLYRLGTIGTGAAGGTGEALLQQVVDDFPDSPFVPLALLRLAEVAMSAQDYDRARVSLEASTHWHFDGVDFAVYKLAWSLRHLDDYEQALDMMVVAVIRSRVGLGQVARDAALAWAEELGREEELRVVLQRIPSAIGTCLDDVDDRRSRIVGAPMSRVSLHEQLAVIACLVEVDQSDSAKEEELLRLSRGFGRYSRWYENQDRAGRKQARVAIRRARKALRRRPESFSPD